MSKVIPGPEQRRAKDDSRDIQDVHRGPPARGSETIETFWAQTDIKRKCASANLSSSKQIEERCENRTMSDSTSHLSNDRSKHRPVGLCEDWGLSRQVGLLVKVLETPEWTIYVTPRRLVTSVEERQAA